MSRPLVLTILLLLLQLVPAAAAERVALIIGNARYTEVGELANPQADAQAVAAAFSAAGFNDVTLAAAMREALKAFAARAAGAEMAVIYYAGHGAEAGGQNYLIPVDAKLLRAADIEFEAITLTSVRSALAGATGLRMVVLDACRNNPFKLTALNGRRAATRGLAGVEVEASEIIAYSAKEGTLAQDGPQGANSPFAAALVKSLAEPGLEIRLLFGRVRDDVRAATGNEQEPYTYNSLGGEPVYLKPPLAVSGAAQEWQIVSASSSRAVLEAFRDRYAGDAVFRNLAEEKLALLALLAPRPLPGSSFSDCPDCPEMVVLPGGNFLMGSPPGEADREKDEGPQRLVSIGRSFALGRFEVSLAQYNKFVEDSGHQTGSSCYIWNGKQWKDTAGRSFRNPGFAQTAAHPATCLSHADAVAYVAWLAVRTGKPYRLPSEAEWEYAARAGVAGPFATGAAIKPEQANFAGLDTMPVGRFAANGFGLFDMHGNVWEWTADCYTADYSGVAAAGADCKRVYRGGGWVNGAKDLRLAARGWNSATLRGDVLGIRVARTLE